MRGEGRGGGECWGRGLLVLPWVRGGRSGGGEGFVVLFPLIAEVVLLVGAGGLGPRGGRAGEGDEGAGGDGGSFHLPGKELTIRAAVKAPLKSARALWKTIEDHVQSPDSKTDSTRCHRKGSGAEGDEGEADDPDAARKVVAGDESEISCCSDSLTCV